MDRAAGVVRSPNTTTAVLLHSGELRVLQKRMEEAGKLADAAETMLNKNPDLKKVFQTELDDLKSKLK